MAWRNWQATRDYMGVNFIHPLKQRQVEQLLDSIIEYGELDYAIIFGSATENRCTPFSDVDVLLIGDKGRGFCPPNNGEVYDILNAERIPGNAPVWKDIERDGVVIYER